MTKLLSFLLMIFFCGLSLISLFQVFGAPNSFAAFLYFIGFVFTSKLGFSYIDRSFK